MNRQIKEASLSLSPSHAKSNLKWFRKQCQTSSNCGTWNGRMYAQDSVQFMLSFLSLFVQSIAIRRVFHSLRFVRNVWHPSCDNVFPTLAHQQNETNEAFQRYGNCIWQNISLTMACFDWTLAGILKHFLLIKTNRKKSSSSASASTDRKHLAVVALCCIAQDANGWMQHLLVLVSPIVKSFDEWWWRRSCWWCCGDDDDECCCWCWCCCFSNSGRPNGRLGNASRMVSFPLIVVELRRLDTITVESVSLALAFQLFRIDLPWQRNFFGREIVRFN